jgi:hypothetical protein
MARKRSENEGTRYGRKSPYQRDDRDDREGKKRPKRHIEEKLLKYEAQAAGFEFIPARMFTLERYVEGTPEKQQTDLERRLGRALDEIPESRTILKEALDVHREIPREIKRRAFSLRMEDRPRDKGISDGEMAEIIDRANVFKNRAVATLATSPAARHPKHPMEGCCCPTDEPPRDPPPPARRRTTTRSRS